MIKGLIRKGLNKISGKRFLQPFWRRLYEVSLTGMNFGAIDIDTDGEKEVLKLIRNSNPIIFDVGANKGDYSLEIVAFFKDMAKIYCFEPSKETFGLLSDNIGNYRNVELYNFGFGDKEGMVDFYSCGESGFDSVFLGGKASLNEKITIKRVDNFCKEKNINHINLLKVDAEGSEWSVLKGAKSLIDSDSIDYIQFEFGGCDIDARVFFHDFFNFLNPSYKIYRILKDGLFLIDKYSEKEEIFHAVNYLAVSRKL